MIISSIRAYLKKQVLEADSSLKENPSAFYDDDIGESIIDKSFQIEINNFSLDRREYQYERVLSCTVSIFGFGYKDPISKYDELLDKALCISDNIINLKSFNDEDFITNAVENSLTVTQLPSDDNGFKVDINFNITIAYSKE